MARLCLAVVAIGCLAFVAASQSARFNADLSSPSLVRSLATDYVAVDTTFGGITNPYTISAVLHRQDPPPPSMGFVIRAPALTIAKAADGIRYAQEAESAVTALGATAELAPIRVELLHSYRDVERAWRMEQVVELNSTPNGIVSVGHGVGEAPSVQSAVDISVMTIRQAQSLHDQAMAAVAVLSGKEPAGPSTSRRQQAPARSFSVLDHP
ncbi:MAG: hypothetical protein ACR2JY_07350 [Chloroflexota bacterium]